MALMLSTDAAGIEEEPHGGGLDTARHAWPDAPLPWIDLSTGINPWPYPLPPVDPEAWTRLPDTAALDRLQQAASSAYGAPAPDRVVAAPGTQALIQWLPRLVPPTRVAVLGPTYGEHAACWRLAGHAVEVVPDLAAALAGPARVVVVVNPNNPDGRVLAPDPLLAAAGILRARGGWLLVDEAFADMEPARSLAGAVDRPGLLVLRSLGKFYGLAGLRVGFALAAPATAALLRRAIGPWAVAGPALAVAATALEDGAWADRTRNRLRSAADRLDHRLERGGLAVRGGTTLFRLAAHPQAVRFADGLAGAGILVRRFADHPSLLRFGLPPDDVAAARLVAALERVAAEC